MNYDASVRREIKAEQKVIIKANFKRVLGAQVLCALPMVLLSVISTVLSLRSTYAALGASFQSELQQTYSTMSDINAIMLLLQLVIGAPLTLGLMNFMIELMRGGQPAATSVLHPLTSLRTAWRGMRMALVMYLRSLIWMLAPIVLFSIAFAAIMFNVLLRVGNVANASMTDITNALLVPAIVLYIVFLVAIMFISVKVATYQAGYVRLYDNEHIGTWDASREGAQAFRGHYKDLLVFFLSFAPWYILYIVLLCVSMVPMSIGTIVFRAGGAGFIAMIVVSIILLVAVMLTLGVFLSSYQTTSFLRLFERLAPAPEQPEGYTAFRVEPQAPEQDRQLPEEDESPHKPEE